MSTYTGSGVDGGTTGGRTTPRRALDPALVGHWRHTDSMYGGGYSTVTDTHFVLYGNGRFASFSKTRGDFGSSDSPEEYGTWHTEDGLLHVRFDGGEYGLHQYVVYPDRVYLPVSGQLWNRVR